MDTQMVSIVTIVMRVSIQVVEIPNDGIDQDCDGSDLVVFADTDGDGFTADVDCNDFDALSIQEHQK